MNKKLRSSFSMLRGSLLAAVIVSLAGAFATGTAGAQTKSVTFMSGGAAADWFRYLTAKSECMRQFSDINANTTPTSGGMEAFVRVAAGEADFTYAFQNVMHPAWYGQGEYEGQPVKTLMPVGLALGASMVHLVVLEDSGIETVEDLRGKSVSPGPAGTVSYGIVSQLLEAVGVLEDIEVANISHDEQVTYLKDGKIDAFGITNALPGPQISEISVSTPIRLLSLQAELEAVGFFADQPYYAPVTIPAGTYSGVDYDVPTAGVTGVLVANSELPEDLVYEVTATLWGDDCIEYLTSNHRGLAEMAAENPTSGIATPMHPGAIRYWTEKGIEVSAPKE